MTRAPHLAAMASLLFVCASCGSPERSSSTPTASSTSSARTSALPRPASSGAASSPTSAPTVDADAPYRCEKDTDCYISCRYGAVNDAWYRSATRPECKDGCQQGATKVRCEDRVCVAYAGDERDDRCTKRPIRKDD